MLPLTSCTSGPASHSFHPRQETALHTFPSIHRKSHENILALHALFVLCTGHEWYYSLSLLMMHCYPVKVMHNELPGESLKNGSNLH